MGRGDLKQILELKRRKMHFGVVKIRKRGYVQTLMNTRICFPELEDKSEYGRNHVKISVKKGIISGICAILCLGVSFSASATEMIWRLNPATAASIGQNEIGSASTSIYDRPYSLNDNQIDKKMLWRNSGALVGVGLGTMGFLYLMPSSFTNWDDDDDEGPFEKWWDNVSREPVWDKDDFFLNYVTHPYAGAIYYMGARSAGANAGYSFLYSFAMSTFFWEYGIEAFAERPSIQDLIVTPVAGALVGEWFYMTKRRILENNHELWGSEALGRTAVLLMDPITEVADWLWGEERPMSDSLTFSAQPTVTRSGRIGYGLSMQLRF